MAKTIFEGIDLDQLVVVSGQSIAVPVQYLPALMAYINDAARAAIKETLLVEKSATFGRKTLKMLKRKKLIRKSDVAKSVIWRRLPEDVRSILQNSPDEGFPADELPGWREWLEQEGRYIRLIESVGAERGRPNHIDWLFVARLTLFYETLFQKTAHLDGDKPSDAPVFQFVQAAHRHCREKFRLAQYALLPPSAETFREKMTAARRWENWELAPFAQLFEATIEKKAAEGADVSGLMRLYHRRIRHASDAPRAGDMFPEYSRAKRELHNLADLHNLPWLSLIERLAG